MTRSSLSICQKLSYGVGHILNDFTASMWFSYLLIFLHRVANFKSTTAGYMLLIGQVADAISTIIVGFLSDKTRNGFCNYGSRKSWHLLGVFCVLLGFPFSFNLCISCKSLSSQHSELSQFIYYIPFVVIFQFGWASSQISHLALIPELTNDPTERVSLNSIRYSFTVISSLFVYVLTYLSLRLNINTSEPNSDVSHLTSADAPKFMFLSLIVCAVGFLFQAIFHLGTRERPRRSPAEIVPEKAASQVTSELDLKHEWCSHLKSTRFYMVGVLYMSTRLIINICQVYVPMYLTDSIELKKQSIALIPFICYLSGFLATLPLSRLTKLLGSHLACLLGLALILVCCVLFWYHELIISKSVNSMVAAAVLGVGSTIVSVTSISIITELIGEKTTTGAFVYGSMSFTDKISSGLAVVLLEEFSPCQTIATSESCKNYYFYVMSIFPSVCTVVSIAALIALVSRDNKIAAAIDQVKPIDAICEPKMNNFGNFTEELNTHTNKN